MTLEDYRTIAEIIQAIVTAVGIVAAGVWTIYNFGITRISAPQVNMSLTLKSVSDIQQKRIAIIVVSVTNNGRTRVVKKSALLAVKPIQAKSNWPTFARITTPLNYQGEVHEILTTHSYLEPSEEYHEEIGLVVSECDLLQVGIAFVGVQRFQTWETNSIFDVSILTGKG